VAQARIGDLEKLCDWYVSLCSEAFSKSAESKIYELAYLYFRA